MSDLNTSVYNELKQGRARLSSLTANLASATALDQRLVTSIARSRHQHGRIDSNFGQGAAMADITFTRKQVEALVAKLNRIDFTDDERAMLQAVFQAAAGGAEVEGFGLNWMGSLALFSTAPQVHTTPESPMFGGTTSNGGGIIRKQAQTELP